MCFSVLGNVFVSLIISSLLCLCGIPIRQVLDFGLIFLFSHFFLSHFPSFVFWFFLLREFSAFFQYFYCLFKVSVIFLISKTSSLLSQYSLLSCTNYLPFFTYFVDVTPLFFPHILGCFEIPFSFHCLWLSFSIYSSQTLILLLETSTKVWQPPGYPFIFNKKTLKSLLRVGHPSGSIG